MIKNQKNRPKHLRPQTVDLLRNLAQCLRVSHEDIANHLGISRCYVTMMLNHHHPFIMKYYQPMDDYLYEREWRSILLKQSKVKPGSAVHVI